MDEREFKQLQNHINSLLNDRLCEMKPNYDDSITGFNEAWGIVRAVFEAWNGQKEKSTD